MANFGRVKFLISLGSNMGDRNKNLAAVRNELTRCCGKLLKESAIYETAPWGFDAQKWFLNQVVIVESAKHPENMLESILKIEEDMGRERDQDEAYQSRVADIDILLIDDQVINTSALTIPHPRMHERNFVLVPAVEIAADWKHPVMAKTLKVLLSECSDREEVHRI